MANWNGLVAGRQHVLAKAGWDVNSQGLTGAPPVRVLAGADRHIAIDVPLRYLGLGAPTLVADDDQGRVKLDALAEALEAGDGPTIVCLAAGNLHSGAFEALGEATALAHEHGAWVHVDGAFGLWAGASPRLRHLVAGYETCDSWATDAHKTLNVPYDCGIAIVANPEALRTALGIQASYLIHASDKGDPLDRVAEMSRRARGVTVWAALRSLGRSGVAALVDGMVDHAQALAAGIAEIPGAEILNEVVFTQVSVSFGSDERTREVTERLLASGEAWMSGSRWKGRDVMRVSVSNWSSDDADVRALAGRRTRGRSGLMLDVPVAAFEELVTAPWTPSRRSSVGCSTTWSCSSRTRSRASPACSGCTRASRSRSAGQWYSGVLPDRVTIYRLPILRRCATYAEVVDEVRVTVIHELAHHMGIDDDRLDELGWA